LVAARAGVPIVPVGIGGSARVMPRHAKMIRPKKVHVVIGEPFAVEVGESGRASRRAIHEASERLSSELQRLFDLAEARVG
jgi:1-acyl-sn-glycerol-3-phosphate acyltransferase